jgi:hypothetical protein
VEHLKGASLGKALGLPANIRLGWKGLPGKTLELITKIHKLVGNFFLLQESVNYGEKKFYNIGSGHNVKPFTQ